MTNNNNATINKELVNKLSNIIKGYDPYTAYIDDYKQYSNAVAINCKMDQQFIHTCKEYGYDVEVSFCYSLAKSLASGKFDSAEETVIDYINSLTKEDDSILSSPNTTLENNDNAMDKEETTMTNEMIKVTVKVEGLNEVLTHYGIELICSNPSDADTIATGQTPSQYRKGIVAVIITQTPSQYRKGIATMIIREDVYRTIEKDLSIVSNNSTTSVVKEEDIMTNNANTTETNNSTTKKEESTMKNNNTTVTNNSATVEKEEFTMKELVKRITENKKVHDKGYIDRPTLKTIMNEQFGFNFSNRSSRTEMVEALMNKYKDSLRVENEDNSVKEEMTMKKTEAVPATHQVICIDHAYYDDEFVAFAGTQEECNDYIDRHFTEEDARLGLFSYTIHPVPIDIPVGDLSITSDRIYHDDTIIEKAVPAKVNNPAPDDANVLTYRLMHKIGDHALSNRKKGFGTTISAWMLCAYILKVKYGMTYLKGHEHEVTDEMKETVKDVRNWLLSNGYIKPVTFKDEKGFTFYTPEYDGNRKDKMYDCTKFRATGKVETTTYMVTKKMNKWYV